MVARFVVCALLSVHSLHSVICHEGRESLLVRDHVDACCARGVCGFAGGVQWCLVETPS